jgi:DNA-binding transcriptional ArsR family regulator
MMTIYEVLVDPTRRRILDLLRDRPHMVGEMVEALQIIQPVVSKQLRVLRDVGLVQVRQDAQRRWYELRPEPLEEVVAWLQPYRQVMEAQYKRLDDVLTDLQGDADDDENARDR